VEASLSCTTSTLPLHGNAHDAPLLSRSAVAHRDMAQRDCRDPHV